MARFNETVMRDPSRRMQDDRRASLESRGADIAGIMARTGLGERRAMATAERDLSVHWHNGSFGLDAGHYPGAPK